MTLFKAGDTVDMTGRARQKLHAERKKTIQSRINELTGQEPEFGFNLLGITRIKVLRERLRSIEVSRQSPNPLLTVRGGSNISTTFEDKKHYIDRERQKVQYEKKKTIQSRINELTGEEPRFDFDLLRTTGIKVLRERLRFIEESQQSQYPPLPVDGRSNISTTFEPEEEQQNGDAGMLDGGGEDDSIWDKNVNEQTDACWSSRNFDDAGMLDGGGDDHSIWDKNVDEQRKAWWSSQNFDDESWKGFQDHDTAKFQQ
ncbi:hypothetical protein B9479_007754 [Cryptococcus floricola]|uniref:Uncharacterized protein n=1 Tax=Cryptococcus floricola TaxID=2591691 RepID=A0A5D3APR5_9TREE|nr:hypothetical protein B9479_007754 [Cryptococcus floricola]